MSKPNATKSARQWTKRETAELQKLAREVKRRREALGISQRLFDQAAGFKVRTVQWVERLVVDRRTIDLDDPRVGVVLSTLKRLESKGVDIEDERKARSKQRMSRRVVPKERERVEREPVTLEATLLRCPDQDLWITQAGCEGMLGTSPICRSLRSGKGCRGVKHRAGLDRKEIAVDYTPPTPAELEQAPKRWRVS